MTAYLQYSPAFGAVLLLALSGCSRSAQDTDVSPAQDVTEVQIVTEVVEENISEMACEPTVEVHYGSEVVCRSITGRSVHILNGPTGCYVSASGSPTPNLYGSSINRCVDPMIWRIDNGEPVAFLYRTNSREPDEEFEGWGTWNLLPVATSSQIECVAHKIQGQDSKPVALERLRTFGLKHNCDQGYGATDVN